MNMLFLLEGFRDQGIGRQFVTFWEKEMQALGYAYGMRSRAAGLLLASEMANRLLEVI